MCRGNRSTEQATGRAKRTSLATNRRVFGLLVGAIVLLGCGSDDDKDKNESVGGGAGVAQEPNAGEGGVESGNAGRAARGGSDNQSGSDSEGGAEQVAGRPGSGGNANRGGNTGEGGEDSTVGGHEGVGGASELGGNPGEGGNPGTGGAGELGGSGDTQASCEGLFTDTDNRPMTPSLPKPARFENMTDPEFLTRVVRVTDVAEETGGEVIKTLYSTIQAWNADESYLIVYEVGGGHRLYDGRTYEFVRTLDIDPPDLEQVYWDPRDPDTLHYVRGNEFMEYSVSQDQNRVVHQFDWCESVSAGDDPMYISWDGNAYGLLCQDSQEAFVYHLDTDTESARVDAPDLGPQVAPSGNIVYLGGEIYDGDMNHLSTLPVADPYEHASLGMLADGTDTFNTVAFDEGPEGSGVGTLVVFDMTTGQDRVIIGEDTGYPYPPSGTHISAVGHRAPGWVAVSVVGYEADGQSLLDNELLLADTNTGTVCRIGHHRSQGNNGPQGYWAEPHPVISPSGTRVLFSSDWEGGATVDVYVVELPSYQGR